MLEGVDQSDRFGITPIEPRLIPQRLATVDNWDYPIALVRRWTLGRKIERARTPRVHAGLLPMRQDDAPQEVHQEQQHTQAQHECTDRRDEVRKLQAESRGVRVN